MDKFDDQYLLLEQLYDDSFYPDFLVDKIKYLLEDFINYLETSPQKQSEIEDKIYELVHSVNNFQYEFLDNESEFDNLARECLIRDIEYILQWFHFPINVEEVLAQKEWE